MQAKKITFELSRKIYESALLSFKGVDGWDVYNCSVPFTYKGEVHLYGRVEKRSEWANSHVRLFVRTGKDEYTVVPCVSYEMEDPYIQKVDSELILGGTHTRKSSGKVRSYYGFFYRGPSPADVRYFTSGPDFMKDIRVVKLQNGSIGVFSRKRDTKEVYVGFTTVDSLDHLTMEVIAAAKPLDLFEQGAWGGVNQPYLLSSGKIGCIAHYSYYDKSPAGLPLSVYTNFSFIFDPATHAVSDQRIIGTKSCYPDAPAKVLTLLDCVFTSGMVVRPDGKCDLYSGVADTCEGRITIDYPFEGHGSIVGDLTF